jgi:hypothetical protein
VQFIGVPFPFLYCSPRRYEVADASNPYVSATDVRFPDHTKVREDGCQLACIRTREVDHI